MTGIASGTKATLRLQAPEFDDDESGIRPTTDAVTTGQDQVVPAVRGSAPIRWHRSIVRVSTSTAVPLVGWAQLGLSCGDTSAISAWIEAAAPTTPAQEWINRMSRSVTGWRSPLHTVGAWNEDVFEWWAGPRKLTVHLDENAEYLKVWGPDTQNEMESGTIGEQSSFADLWAWLNGDA